MTTRLLLIAILCLSVAPAAADDPAQANRLLVEAAKLFRQANQTETAGRLALLEGALAVAQMVSNSRPNPRVDISFRDTVLGLIAGVQAEESGDLQGAEVTIRMIKAAALREQLLDALRLLRIKAAREAEETR